MEKQAYPLNTQSVESLATMGEPKMTNNNTVQKLRSMGLTGMADAYREHANDKLMANYSFDERLAMLVDIEWDRRKNNRLKRLIYAANFKFNNANIAEVDYHEDRKLDRSSINALATCTYITNNENIIITGASGSGKTWIACAFGMAACMKQYTTKYIRLPELLEDIDIAKRSGTRQRVIDLYAKAKLLIIDEWLLTSVNEREAKDLFEIVESRYMRGSTILCSQFKTGGWHDKIGQNTLADAILDRLVHNAHHIFIESNVSMRDRRGLAKNKP